MGKMVEVFDDLDAAINFLQAEASNGTNEIMLQSNWMDKEEYRKLTE